MLIIDTIKEQVFYIGDNPANDISKWADEIAEIGNMTTNNILNLDNLFNVIKEENPYNRIQGIRKTLKWIEEIK